MRAGRKIELVALTTVLVMLVSAWIWRGYEPRLRIKGLLLKPLAFAPAGDVLAVGSLAGGGSFLGAPITPIRFLSALDGTEAQPTLHTPWLPRRAGGAGILACRFTGHPCPVCPSGDLPRRGQLGTGGRMPPEPAGWKPAPQSRGLRTPGRPCGTAPTRTERCKKLRRALNVFPPYAVVDFPANVR